MDPFVRAFIACRAMRAATRSWRRSPALKGAVFAACWLARSIGVFYARARFCIDGSTDEAERITRALENVPLATNKDEDGYPIADAAQEATKMTNSADLASCESADIQRRILELIEGASSIRFRDILLPGYGALGSVLGLGLSLLGFPNRDIALLLADDDWFPRISTALWEGLDRLVSGICVHRQSGFLFISVGIYSSEAH